MHAQISVMAKKVDGSAIRTDFFRSYHRILIDAATNGRRQFTTMRGYLKLNYARK